MPFGGWSGTCLAVVIHDPTHRGPAASQLDDSFRPRGPEHASHRQSGDAPRIDTRFLKGVTKVLPVSPAGARILPCALKGGCVDLAAQPLHIDLDPGRRQECIAASASDAGNADRSCRCDGAHQYAGVRKRDDAAWASPTGRRGSSLRSSLDRPLASGRNIHRSLRVWTATPLPARRAEGTWSPVKLVRIMTTRTSRQVAADDGSATVNRVFSVWDPHAAPRDASVQASVHVPRNRVLQPSWRSVPPVPVCRPAQ